MSNYEIMLILDPNSDEKIIFELAKSTFKSEAKIEKLERTELAYEINKSKTALYFLVNVQCSGQEINEFTRKVNITKNIWRILSINLSTEKGLNRKVKPKKFKKNINFSKKPRENNKNPRNEKVNTNPKQSTNNIEKVSTEENK
ncbi:MAG: 30S ribosomal protein S6 [Mycoplasmataceae bacterium]|nr:30S ribosomal protein S6 [Mycoplasmataceae bacterium]MBR2999316.1 30S ribosomal protein S6 [Mycoplasmataceae bacterium]MBR3832190.1 30S ribosomal protein S6 [Mycoplasmataceae bacterium]MBR4025907.1 30S ribosomal protein S6 [Mycoplasmataceae bacterium]